jgi:uncharacterized repeat protein (TIGR03803 family)
MCALAAFGTLPAQAQTYTVLHRFTGPDGANPEAGLIADPAGNLFGTTMFGGPSNSGTVFKLNSTGLTVLYGFTGGADGGNPAAGLIRDSVGTLHGTTYDGGAGDEGAVFKLDAAGTETVLHSFRGEGDGAFPIAGLIQDAAGNLYGTTQEGGASSQGLVFGLNRTGETALHSFTEGEDGGNPSASLIQDSAGNLYGTTALGGALGNGVVFKVETNGTETVLHSFTGGADGAFPLAGLIQDSAGNFYGTTEFGGAAGQGVVFKLDTTGAETVLYTFTGGADGGNPVAGLVLDSAGNFYGTTVVGGSAMGPAGHGVVFELDATGAETVLHTFAGGEDGSQPMAGLIRDLAGNLYGTTFAGGKNSTCNPIAAGCGVVFKIAP